MQRHLHDCIRRKDLAGGRRLVSELLLLKQRNEEDYPLLSAHLIRLLALCGALDEADRLFHALQSHPSTWRAIISAHSKFGHSSTTLSLFAHMLHCNVEPCVHTFVAALKACSVSSSAEKGILMHAHIVENGFEYNPYLSSTLIDMYSKCGRLEDAQSVFEDLPEKNVFSWTSIICGHSHLRQGYVALQFYNQMQQKGIQPNYVTFVCVLKACSSISSSDMGRVCHCQIVEVNHEVMMGFDAIGSSLVDMYVKSGRLKDAQWVFNAIADKTLVTWTALITGYAQAGYDEEEIVFYLFQQMQHEGIEACQIAFVSVLTACSNLHALHQGKLIHTQIIVSPCERDVYVANALVNMYVKCGSLQEARQIFDQLMIRDVVTWSTIMAGYGEEGYVEEVFSLLAQAQKEGMEPDNVMFGSVLKTCSKAPDLEQGRLVHSHMVQSGCVLEVFIASSLVDMYAKCGSIEDAQRVFDKLLKRNVVTWSSLMSGYVQLGCEREALQLFKQMQEEGLVADDVTYVSLLKACSDGASLERGILLHEHTIQDSSEKNVIVGNTLIDLYMKCGRIEDALEIFDKLLTRHHVIWSAIIAGLAEQGYCQAALMFFQQMRHEGIEADPTTFVCILKACSKLGALEQGKLVHAQINQKICETDCFVASSLINMYANCGSLKNAQTVFDGLAIPNVVAWSAIISGYAENSEYLVALGYFNQMQHDGIKPVDVTYTSLLCACNRLGLVKEGCYHFECMVKDHGITPTLEHYNCMIDLMGRVGYLHEARDLSFTMPMLPSLVAWMSLLSHCRIHGSMNLGAKCYENVVVIDEFHASSYELMSKLYVDAGEYEKADSIQEKRKHACAWKKAGMAFIEVDNQVHNFLAGDNRQENSYDAHIRVQKIRQTMREEGYIPHVDLVLQASVQCDGYEVSSF